jgi:cytochrome c oxidase assembly protein Cox11
MNSAMRFITSTRATVIGLVAILAVMTGLTSYSVTLYRLFCAATGSGGATQRVTQASKTQIARTVTVYFNTTVAPNMPWRFEPVQRSVKLHLGEESLAFFEAKNLSDHAIVGHATFNVTPDKVGIYFKKIQCFCFNEEKLAPGQDVQMPVTFFVDPRMASDPNTADVDQITLSYTFFQSKRPDDAINLARFAASAPAAQAGGQFFAAQCADCHNLDSNHVGPALRGVVGRESASVPGYPYSAALQAAKLVWTPDTLDHWLAGPQAYVPGAQMPMSVSDATERKDIIAYLTSLPKQQPRPAG